VEKIHVEIVMELEKETGAGFVAKRFLLSPVIYFIGNPGEELIENLLGKAKKYCIISNSVKGEVLVEPTVRFI